MKIAIGIMLWNEEGTIAMTIDSLFAQTLLTEPKDGVEAVEVVVLANGCTDGSIPNASQAIHQNLKNCRVPCVSARVHELPKGRSSAWNQFVHELTYRDVSYIVFMDADIVINNCNAIWSMIEGLERSPYHPVAGALGLKDIDLKPHKTFFEWLSTSMTKMEHDARFFYMCGGLYCGRASFFRRIEFPKGFVCGDDALLATLAITNFWTTDCEFDRILHPTDATFVFEAYGSIASLFRQHRRRLVGGTIRAFIKDYVRSKQKDGAPDAGVIIRQACREDPLWLQKYCQQRIAAAGYWTIRPKAVLYRLTQLRRLHWTKKLARLPLALAGVAWQAAVILSANRAFRSGHYSGVWTNMKNLRMTTETIGRAGQPAVSPADRTLERT